MPLTRPQFAALVHALAVVLPLTAPADALLRHFFREHPELGQRDRGFVAETVYAVLRRRRLLEALSPEGQPRRWALLALNRLNGLGLGELEGVASASEREWLAATKAADLSAAPLAVQLDLPDWLAESLLAEVGEQETVALARGLSTPAPLDLRVNTLFAKREEVLAALAADGIAAAPTPLSPTGIRLTGKPAINRQPLFTSGKVEVQDEGSQLLAYLLEPRRNDMVVDFCAGAGGKTLAIGALMASRGRVYAFDVSAKRLASLKPRLARSGLSNIHPQVIANERDVRVKRLAGKIDRVLVDAPCSGLGTLRRNPDLKWRQTPADLAELSAKQRAILDSAATLVKPGGRLVYATCSILRAENDAVVEDFLARHPDFAPLDAAAVLARQRIALDTGERLRLSPHRHGTDGFFAAIFERRIPESRA